MKEVEKVYHSLLLKELLKKMHFRKKKLFQKERLEHKKELRVSRNWLLGGKCELPLSARTVRMSDVWGLKSGET